MRNSTGIRRDARRGHIRSRVGESDAVLQRLLNRMVKCVEHSLKLVACHRSREKAPDAQSGCFIAQYLLAYPCNEADAVLGSALQELNELHCSRGTFRCGLYQQEIGFKPAVQEQLRLRVSARFDEAMSRTLENHSY